MKRDWISSEKTIVRNPSLSDTTFAFLTNTNGKAPTSRVMIKLISKGTNAESRPSIIETTMDRNMNRALTRSALPTFNDIAFRFICSYLP